MVIGGEKGFRLSYVTLLEPKLMEGGKEPKYSVQILIPKDVKGDDLKGSRGLEAIKTEIDRVTKLAISKNKITKELAASARFKSPIRDGDEYYAEQPGAAREACKGHWFINASTGPAYPPVVVDKRAQPIMNPSEIYSGMIGFVEVNFFAFNTQGNVGISAGLQKVMKSADGERLDGRTSVDEAFGDLIIEDTDEGADLV